MEPYKTGVDEEQQWDEIKINPVIHDVQALALALVQFEQPEEQA